MKSLCRLNAFDGNERDDGSVWRRARAAVLFLQPRHLLGGIERFLDLSELRKHLSTFYSHTGRPSVDPELMIRMLIVGYCFGIRSERRLCGEGFAIDASVVRADAYRARGVPGADAKWPRGACSSRAVREYLDALEQDNPGETPPKSISLTDPAARYTAAPEGPALYAYSTNYLVDVNAGIIVDVEATPAHRTHEVNATRTMIDRVEARFRLKPQRLIGDIAYGTADVLGWLVNRSGLMERSQLATSCGMRSERIPMSGRSRVTCIAAALQEPADRHHQGKHNQVPRKSVRLLVVRTEAAVLPEHSEPPDHQKHP